jgi:hypothetical protein
VPRVLAFTGQGIGSWNNGLIHGTTRLTHKVEFIRERKLQVEQCSGAWKPVTPCWGEVWGFLWML